MPDPTQPSDPLKLEEPQPAYGELLRQLLSDIAGHDKKRLATEATIATVSAKLTKKDKLGSKDLQAVGQLSDSHKIGEQAKKHIEKNISLIQKLTVEPLRQVFLHTPLVLQVEGYTFTISTAPNSINAWMLDLSVVYTPA